MNPRNSCRDHVPRARALPLRLHAAALTAALMATGCAPGTRAAPPPPVVPGAAWRAEAPVGYPADALRRNIPPGDTLRFGGLSIGVRGAIADSGGGRVAPEGAGAVDTVAPARAADLVLLAGGRSEARRVPAGTAIRWNGYRVAVLAVRGAGELGGGLVELEVATLASLPDVVARSDTAGGAELRLRVPHDIRHVTLHHTGSPEPLRPDEDPVERLRGLQRWGRTDRNWWDVPYHFLIDLDGRIYEGRDWRYMGETNTTYDPRGHFLISVMGNYGRQEPTPAQLEAIMDMMAWAVGRFDLPLDRIGGHYDHAETSCPGTHLRKYLEDGTFRRGVRARLR